MLAVYSKFGTSTCFIKNFNFFIRSKRTLTHGILPNTNWTHIGTMTHRKWLRHTGIRCCSHLKKVLEKNNIFFLVFISMTTMVSYCQHANDIIRQYFAHKVILCLPEDIYLLNLGADKVGIPVRHYIPVYFASFHYMMGLPMVLMLSEVVFLVFDILLVYFETRPSEEKWHIISLINVNVNC